MAGMQYKVNRSERSYEVLPDGTVRDIQRTVQKPIRGKAICGCGLVIRYGPEQRKIKTYDEAQAALNKHRETCKRKDRQDTLAPKNAKKNKRYDPGHS
jgi:hypothetical protein